MASLSNVAAPHEGWWDLQIVRSAEAVADGWRLFTELHQQSQWDRARLEQVRSERLRSMLRHAREHVPSYESTIGSDLNLDDPFGALADLPVTCKETLREEPDAFTSRVLEPSETVRVLTSGTTGAPAPILHDRSRFDESIGLGLRLWQAHGLAPGAGVLRLSANPSHELLQFGFQPLMGLAPTLRVSISALTADNAGVVAEVVRHFAPAVLWGQPMEVLLAADRARAGLFRPPPPTIVLTHGDSTSTTARQVIVETFQAPLVDVYGLQEFGRIAWSCPQQPDTYHVDEERVHLELDGDGQSLLVTGLVNRAMPLLRYRTEDRARISDGPCPCGRVLGRLAGIEGRQRAFLVDREGNPINTKSLRLFLAGLPLARWQVVQREPGAITVRAATVGGGLADTLRSQIVAGVRAEVALQRVDVEPVDLEALTGATGKATLFELLVTQETLANQARGRSRA